MAQKPPAAKPASPPVVKASDSAENQPEKPVDAAAADAKVRRFTFQYRFHVKGLKPAGDPEKDLVQMWLPSAVSSEFQQVKRLTASAPGELTEHQEARFGNQLLYAQFPVPESGEFSVEVPYEVVRHEVLRGKTPPQSPEKLSDEQRALFVVADKMVPITGKPLKLLESVKLSSDKLVLARQLYDLVDGHVAYRKEGTGWGRGDTNWVCDSGYGNCTDFHSLFISLARSQGLPSRFEIGFSIPTDVAEGPVKGYHCWGWFYVEGRGWLPVDISEADKHPELKDYYFGNLTADRVMFSAGRDLELVPKSKHPPLNFFIFPYLEVGGQPLAAENVEMQTAFKDQEEKP